MSKTKAVAYLQHVLELAPDISAAEMLRMRQTFLAPSDLIIAEESDESPEETRTRWSKRLHEVRRDFWQLDDTVLRQRLEAIRLCGIPESAISAARLLQVADQRAAFAQLRSDGNASPTFVRALSEIVIAPSSTANQLREREHGWMRPEQNPQHAVARQAIVASVLHIKVHYPGINALEETWLNELATYNPADEQVDEGSNTLFGIATVIFALMVFVGQVNLIKWMFS